MDVSPPGPYDQRNVAWPEPARGPRGLLRRIARRVRSALEPMSIGFEEHEWTGKLYMITSAIVLVATLGGTLVTIPMAILIGTTGAPVAAVLIASAIGLALTFFVQWKLLLGVARFRRWARNIAIIATGFGAVAGLGILMSGGGFQPKVIGLVEGTLSLQFFLYFLRNGALFRRGAHVLPAAEDRSDRAQAS